ncbi:MAG: hypothetical protein Q9174_004032 [Haloplaca sp. 1 TL-2023]
MSLGSNKHDQYQKEQSVSSKLSSFTPAASDIPDGKESPAPRDSIFFRLPLELREPIYRHLVVSPLSSSTHISLRRPLCVDGTTYKIGYFPRDTVIPLLLTCHQIHAEATKLLYGENVFIFQVSNLTSAPTITLDIFPRRYLALMKHVYLRTNFFLPSPLMPSEKVSPSLANMEEPRRRQIIATQMEYAKLETEGSKMLAQAAVTWQSGFSVNVKQTIEMPFRDRYYHMGDESEEAKLEEWESNSCQLWKLVLTTGEDDDAQQEFRRIVWSRDSKHGE